MKVGDRLAELLVKNGIDRVFGLPGGQTLPLYEGIRKLNGQIEHVLMRDERSAGFAADAYARHTGKVGVCDATVGPGATNLVSPFAEAYCASIPILAIVSDIPRAWEYRRNRGNASQAIQQLDIFRSVSKWQISLSDPDSVDDVMETAIRVATTGKSGPVVISVPVDVGSAESRPVSPEKHVNGAVFPRHRVAPDPAAIQPACQALISSKKPILVVGGGAHISGAYQSVRKLVDRLKLPVVTPISGKGIIDETHPMSFGVVGTFGNEVANDLLQEADLIFYIACKVGQLTTLRFQYPKQNIPIIHLDSDPEEIGRNYPHSLAIVSDATLGIDALLTSLETESFNFGWHLDHPGTARESWYQNSPSDTVSTDRPLKPKSVMSLVNRFIGENDQIVCDASLASGWAAAYLRLNRAGHVYIAPRGLATLGWGAPASVGTALATNRQNRIIHFAGDGGFGYSVQELETMARLKLPVLNLIFNNSILGWIKHIQKNDYAQNYISTDYSKIDFATVARGFGAKGVKVNSYDELEAAMDQFRVIDGPVVIDINTDQWETPVLTYS